jgi:hypothetical protein
VAENNGQRPGHIIGKVPGRNVRGSEVSGPRNPTW